MTMSCNTPEVSRLNQDLALAYIITWHPVKTLEINQPSILFQDENWENSNANMHKKKWLAA